MKTPLIIIGAGGHAKVLANALLVAGESILGFVDADQSRWGQKILGVDILGGDDKVFSYAVDQILLVNGLGHVGNSLPRRNIFKTFKSKGYRFATVIHPSAVVAKEVVFAEGVQIMAGVILQPGCQVNENVILNTGAILDHDCVVNAHAHVAPGAVLSGGVWVGEGTLIGSGASVVQYKKIGNECVIGAGAVVFHDVGDDITLVGQGRMIIPSEPS